LWEIHQGILSAKLEACILGRNTKVGAKAELLRSLTQAGYEVDAGGTNAFLDSMRFTLNMAM
jgi:translation initiation factor eIF-2B subunit gamma